MEKAKEEAKGKAATSQLYLARTQEGLYIKELGTDNKITQRNFFPSITCCAVSRSGALMVISDREEIHFLETDKFTKVGRAAYPFVQELIISLHQKFLMAYARHSQSKISRIGIFDIKDGRLLKEIQFKRSSTLEEQARISENDDYIMVSAAKNEVTVFATQDFSKPALTYTCPLVLAADLVPQSYLHAKTAAPYLAVIEMIAGTDGEVAAKFVPIKAPDEAEVVIKKFVLKKADGARIIFSPNGSAALLFAESQEDPTGKSYYGVHCMYYRQLVGGKKHCKVSTEGSTIHDMKWTPDGSAFLVMSGSQPAKIVLFSSDCVPLVEVDGSYKNYIAFSDGGRFLMLGGFGNLAGDVEFWDLKAKQLIGNTKAHCTVTAEWAPDSRCVLTAVLNPRMRIDNAISFYASTGGKPFLADSYVTTELYEAKWIRREKARDESNMEVRPGAGLKKPLPQIKPAPPPEPKAKKQHHAEEAKKEVEAPAPVPIVDPAIVLEKPEGKGKKKSKPKKKEITTIKRAEGKSGA